jgi:outer membrane lipoprotein-sorting protein
MRLLPLTWLFAVLALTSSAVAGPPDAATIAQKMKAALEPDHSSTRNVIMLIHSQGETVQWTARQARKNVADHKRNLTVLEEPADVKGVAVLVEERKDRDTSEQWVYLPPIRRVRKLLGFGAFESFLGTDFTYEDLGFIELNHRAFTLLGEETVAGTPCYKVQEVPQHNFYYARIVSLIAKDSLLPLRREYYDVANNLWKTETFQEVQTVKGIPTPLHIRMEDVQTGTSTELKMSDLHYDVDLPDSLFRPEVLPEVLKHPF